MNCELSHNYKDIEIELLEQNLYPKVYTTTENNFCDRNTIERIITFTSRLNCTKNKWQFTIITNNTKILRNNNF